MKKRMQILFAKLSGFFHLCPQDTTSFDQRSTSFQSEKLLRNFARTSFLIQADTKRCCDRSQMMCFANDVMLRINDVALRANRELLFCTMIPKNPECESVQDFYFLRICLQMLFTSSLFTIIRIQDFGLPCRTQTGDTRPNNHCFVG